jgi:hypothetical protein
MGLNEPTGPLDDGRLAESAEYNPINYPVLDLGSGINNESAGIRSGEFLMGTRLDSRAGVTAHCLRRSP